MKLYAKQKKAMKRIHELEKLLKDKKISQEHFVSRSREILGLRELRKQSK
jgi:hypothetical protein